MSPLSWNLILALVWAAITGNFSGANLLVGFGLGYLILGFALRDVPDFARYREKMPRVLMLLTHFLRDLLVSNLRVAYDVLTPTHYMRPAVVAVPLRAKTDGAITILANMISLTPGTLSLDVSSDRSVLYLHVMCGIAVGALLAWRIFCHRQVRSPCKHGSNGGWWLRCCLPPVLLQYRQHPVFQFVNLFAQVVFIVQVHDVQVEHGAMLAMAN